MKGLPICQGEVWHDPHQRQWMIGLAVLAFVPTLGLVALGRGLGSPGWLDGAVVLPVAALAMLAAGLIAGRYPRLFQRLAIGALSGMLGALAYDALCMMAQGTPSGAPMPVWVGFRLPGGADLATLGASYLHHWVATAALWGMAFSLVAGKARWGYGLAYGLAIALVALGIAWTFAPGPWWLPELTWAAIGSLVVGHAIFGALLGFFNEQFQPETRSAGKIIFLRDYQTRVRERR